MVTFVTAKTAHPTPPNSHCGLGGCCTPQARRVRDPADLGGATRSDRLLLAGKAPARPAFAVPPPTREEDTLSQTSQGQNAEGRLTEPGHAAGGAEAGVGRDTGQTRRRPRLAVRSPPALRAPAADSATGGVRVHRGVQGHNLCGSCLSGRGFCCPADGPQAAV